MHSPLVEALQNPACYPHPVDTVDVVETHISWVLLAGERVYKIKKPVDFGFLDFSTLDLRRYYCEEELRLNRRTAPELYLDVVAVTGSSAQPRIAGGGDVLEYAVCMRRFDVEHGFDRLLVAGRLEPAHAEALGEALADLHEQAEIAGSESPWGTPDEVIGPMRDNFTTLLALVGDDSRDERLNRLRAWTEDRFIELEEVLEQRRELGFVRECHGDVHLGNVTLFDDRTTLFDCIEFSPALRWTDVMADVAFAVMDLHDRGSGANAWRLLDRYLARTGDYEGLVLLDFYVVYRALVRAKVAALGLEDGPAADQTRSILAEVDRYLALADRVSRSQRPGLFLTCGVSGSGKSVLARSLVASCGMIRLRSDVERKRLHGLDELDRSGSDTGAGLYAPEATARTYRRLVQLADAVSTAGLPVLVDATFLHEAQRAPFRALAEDREIPFGVLMCQASVDILRDRVERRGQSGRDASEADVAVLERQLETFEPCTSEEGPVRAVETTVANADEAARAWVEERLSSAATNG